MHGIGSGTTCLQPEFRRAFAKAEDLKKRIWFTLGALLVYRLGTYIPLPGHQPRGLCASVQANQAGGVLGLFNMFAGGAVERMAIFALGIMPYISASIIMQLMTSVVPTLRSVEEGRRAGPQGHQPVHALSARGSGAVPGLRHCVGLESGQGIVPIPGGSSASRPRSRWSAAPCS
jgi:preprotein translocase subunit SecY